MEYKLLTPIQIANITLKNRIVLPSMCHGYCDEEGLLTERLEEYVRARAKGGAGMIILPGNPYGKGGSARMALTRECHLHGWNKLADICHEHGCKLFVQLHPSIYHQERDRYITPDTMSASEIAFFVDKYACGARMAMRAGLDGVEIHGAHAHEVAQFLSPYFNHRTDEYGGDFRRRSRFAIEMIRAIKDRTEGEMPLIFRISASEKVIGGRDVDETAQIAPLLVEAGADALHVSVGTVLVGPDQLKTPIAEEWVSATMDVPYAFNVDDTAKVKAQSSVPVIAVGRIVDPQMAEDVIAQGKADLVALGRPQLADADFVAKMVSGLPIRPCLGCNQGCRGPHGKDIFCTQNPRTGREHSLTYSLADKEHRKRKILIAGAGIAGLEAAVVLAQRGYKPIVFEKESRVGGLIHFAAKPPHKDVMSRMVDCRVAECEALGVEIRLNTPFTAEVAKQEHADVVIVATGSKALSLTIEAGPRDHVYLADEVFERDLPEKSVAILGGGVVGCEVAELLAAQGKEVAIFEMDSEIARGLCEFRKAFLFERLREAGVDVRVGTKVERVDLPAVHVINGRYRHVVRGFDAVVAAFGRKSVNGLAEEVCALLPDITLHVVGDAIAPHMAIDATYSAALCASEI